MPRPKAAPDQYPIHTVGWDRPNEFPSPAKTLPGLRSLPGLSPLLRSATFLDSNFGTQRTGLWRE